MEEQAAVFGTAVLFIERFSVASLINGRNGFPVLRSLARAMPLLNVPLAMHVSDPNYYLRVVGMDVPAPDVTAADVTAPSKRYV
jgi:hypothetical protein